MTKRLNPLARSESSLIEAVGPADLTASEQALLDAASTARRDAHAPYSRFQVGAALELADGSIVTGVNIENASYGLTICAERVAVFRAVADGKRDFVALAVAGPGENVAPCGACRQVLAEFADASLPVIFPLRGEIARTTLGDLLPYAFRPEGVAAEEH
jgi:cytidine deaminase